MDAQVSTFIPAEAKFETEEYNRPKADYVPTLSTQCYQHLRVECSFRCVLLIWGKARKEHTKS